MTLVRSATRGLLFLALALLSLPLAMYTTGQIQMTGIAGVVTGLGLLAFHMIGLAFGGVPAKTARRTKTRVRRTAPPVRGLSISQRWAQDELTWNQISKTKPTGTRQKERASNYSGRTYRIR